MTKRKTYKLNHETLLYEIKEVSKRTVFAKATLVFLASVALAALYFFIYTVVLGYDSPKTVIMKKTNARWETRLELMNTRLDAYEEILGGLESRNGDVYRSIFGMDNMPAGVFGNTPTGPIDESLLENVNPNSPLARTARRLDAMTRQVFLQTKSYDEVATLSKRAGDMASCRPAIPPFLPDKSKYRISSSFGYRTDPVYGGSEFHTGQDFPMKSGTPIYATGDGVVESVNFRFNGYGNEVVIDHGFGYKTRYAHLSIISITEGMKLKRGDCIGQSGNSGKSTGPHLHYEVIYRDSRVNPMNFMDLEMSVDEYKAMVNLRSSQTKELLSQPFSLRSR